MLLSQPNDLADSNRKERNTGEIHKLYTLKPNTLKLFFVLFHYYLCMKSYKNPNKIYRKEYASLVVLEVRFATWRVNQILKTKDSHVRQELFLDGLSEVRIFSGRYTLFLVNYLAA